MIFFWASRILALSYAFCESRGISSEGTEKNDVSTVPEYSGYALISPPSSALRAIFSSPRFSSFFTLYPAASRPWA